MKLFFYITFFFFGISISKSIEIDTVWKTEQPYSIVIEGTFSDSSNILVRHSNILISANPNTGELIKGTERPFDYFFKFAFVNDSIVYLVSKENLIFKYNYDKGVVL